MKKLKVYIASAYSNGWMPDNVRRQIEAKHILMDYGFIPFAPLENHFSEIFKHRKESDWMEWDLEWLKVCDILIRIRSYENNNEVISPGSDKEMEIAKQNDILIFQFNSLKDLEHWAKHFNKNQL